jgi:hypothetical protein
MAIVQLIPVFQFQFIYLDDGNRPAKFFGRFFFGMKSIRLLDVIKSSSIIYMLADGNRPAKF